MEALREVEHMVEDIYSLPDGERTDPVLFDPTKLDEHGWTQRQKQETTVRSDKEI